jgi:photosystem II stability/assembly factor-like uncharacterized protein
LTETSLGVPTPILDGTDEPAELYDIWMLDEDQGWVVGLRGVLQYTDDGGATWQEGHPSGTPPDIEEHNPGDCDDFCDIVFVDANIAIAPADWGRVYRTTNGGLDWSYQQLSPGSGHFCSTETTPPNHPYLELWAVDFLPGSTGSSAVGWMAGGAGTNGGFLYHTTDAGASWTMVSDFLAGAWASAIEETCGISTFYNVMSFGPLQGTTPIGGTVAIGYGEAVARYRTATASNVVAMCDECSNISTTSGPYWAIESPAPGSTALEPAAPFTGAFALDDATGWACGRMGLVRRTDDSGETWQDQGSVQGLRLVGGGDFVSGTVGCVIGQENIIQRTTDGGVTFDVVWPTGMQGPDVGQSGIDLDFSDVSGLGIAIGAGGRVLTTSNSGATWSQVANLVGSSNAKSVEFVPGSSTLFVVGLNVAARAVSGGASSGNWTVLTLPTSRSVTTFYDASFLETGSGGGNPVYSGYIVGEDEVVLFSDDSGASWTELTVEGASASRNLLSVQAFGEDAEHAVAVGTAGRVYLRHNGGDFEEIVIPGAAFTLEDLNDVRILNDGEDWIIGGNHGTVLLFDGTTWTRPKSKTSENIVDVPYLATDHAFAIGLQFAICEYE